MIFCTVLFVYYIYVAAHIRSGPYSHEKSNSKKTCGLQTRWSGQARFNCNQSTTTILIVNNTNTTNNNNRLQKTPTRSNFTPCCWTGEQGDDDDPDGNSLPASDVNENSHAKAMVCVSCHLPLSTKHRSQENLSMSTKHR